MTQETKDRLQNAAADRREASGNAPQDHGDACRCKEASTLSPRELLRLMMDDLAFWKKKKGG